MALLSAARTAARLIGSCSRLPALSNTSVLPTPSLARQIHIPSSRHLNDIVKLDLFQNETTANIREIWTKYHENPEDMRASTVLSPTEYYMFTARAKESPVFVLPLEKLQEGERTGNFMNVLLQMQLPFVLATPLGDYQSQGANAEAFLGVTHYEELAESKEVVLVRADVLARPSGGESLSHAEGATLLDHMYRFYLDDARYQRVKALNHSPESFSFDELIEDVKALNESS